MNPPLYRIFDGYSKNFTYLEGPPKLKLISCGRIVLDQTLFLRIAVRDDYFTYYARISGCKEH